MFSPHTRGCSFFLARWAIFGGVFPAYAGMFRRARGFSGGEKRFPRIRGDVPLAAAQTIVPIAFSPHTRGCSGIATVLRAGAWVFPAYAGMFRVCRVCRRVLVGFPRIRGDVPGFMAMTAFKPVFSPHTRGCSEGEITYQGLVVVFPAYAGMFHTPTCRGKRCPRFPRIRGDVPPSTMVNYRTTLFSPHTRGCSGGRLGC